MTESQIDRSILALPPSERAERYKHLADDMLTLASRTQDERQRREYLAIAAQWRTLEHETRRVVQAAQASPDAIKDRPGP